MTSFASLGLSTPLVHELKRQGFTDAFPIQAAAIPDALAGKDVLGRGPTGSGKTLTFGLPMIDRLAGLGASRPGRPRGLVLAPTRELATQIFERLDELAHVRGLRVIDIVGGVNMNTQIRRLAAPVDIMVATPGRVQDLVNQKHLSLRDVVITALDEADQMADMGFLPQVHKLLLQTTPGSQRLLFSATLDGQVQALVNEFLQDPVTHSTAPVGAAVDTMTHYVFEVPSREERGEVIARIAARAGKTIMFMRTKHGVDRQVKKLRRVGINAVGLHGDKGQGSRTGALTGFGDGSIPVVVATDIAARGIDISDVDLVVHIDPPAEHKAYLHRAGRTARAGASGTVVTLTMPEQRQEVARLLSKAAVTATTLRVTADSQGLSDITGARLSSGEPLGPFIPPQAQPAQKKPKATGEEKQSSGSGRGGARRGSSGRGKKPREKKSDPWGRQAGAPRGRSGRNSKKIR